MKRFLLYGLITALLMLFSLPTIVAQSNTVSKKDGRIIATVNNVSAGMLNKQAQAVDDTKLMKSFDITIQWWSLMGEPVEKYDFTWYDSGRFMVGNTTITRSMLQKYPDLLKRFDNIQPYRVWVFVEGYEGANFNSSSSVDFIYMIDQVKILASKSGRKGDGIVGGSPHWNEFLDWGYNGGSLFNLTNYKKGSRSDQKLFSENKNRFKNINSVTLKASLHRVEWPEYELEAIADRYAKYESGELNPTNATKELEDLNDLLSGSGQTVTDFKIESRDGKRGVVAGDGRILIPFKEWNISSYDPKTRMAEIRKDLRSEIDSKKLCGRKNYSSRSEVIIKVLVYSLATVNSSGDYVIPPKIYGRVWNDWLPPLVLTAGNFNDKRTQAEKEADERRYEATKERNRSECDSWEANRISQIESQLRSEGISVQD